MITMLSKVDDVFPRRSKRTSGYTNNAIPTDNTFLESSSCESSHLCYLFVPLKLAFKWQNLVKCKKYWYIFFEQASLI